MKPNQILIFGSVITIILILLWQFEIIGEPIAALGGGVLTFVGYLLSNKSSKSNEEENKSVKIKQKHSGIGDNIGGDKIINN